MLTNNQNLNANYLADHKPPVIMLSAKSYFDQLTEKEKLYAHYMSKASHAGTRVVLRQVSHESEGIFDLIMKINKVLCGKYPQDNETTLYLEYVSQFLGNLGNYKSFGDFKFIPRCSVKFFYHLLELASIEKLAVPETPNIPFRSYKDLIEIGIFHIDEKSAYLGFPSEGHSSSYYFGNVTHEDMCILKNEVFGSCKILPENTRIKKVSELNFQILVSSELKSCTLKEYPTEPIKLSTGGEATFIFGDHSREMGLVVHYLKLARENASNPTQVAMLDEYIKHFHTGSSHAHKESQKLWVKDLSPIVETNIGFIETYREPSGIIGEFESLVAIQNKSRTAKFSTLVSSAENFISLLPWSHEFEKPKFQPPDFTSLEVLTFTGSGIPAGINIPNYDDVRLNIGFKNVSLGNILNASQGSKKQPVTFVQEKDREMFDKYQSESFEVQVGIHELLGHGSGKLLSELEDGSFNFDKENPPMGLDGNPVTTYYSKGETWGSKFGSLAGAFEECRAEVIAMYLITNRDLLQIFGFKNKEEQEKIIYTGYLQMARAGLMALEFWDPNTGKWGQPHMQARFSIMKTFLKHSNSDEFLKLVYTKDDFSDLEIHLNKDLIETSGHQCIKDYLKHLHVYKSSGNFETGSKYFIDRSTVTPDLARFRKIVLDKKLPRKQIIQANTLLRNGTVELDEYEETYEGMIRSFVEREV